MSTTTTTALTMTNSSVEKEQLEEIRSKSLENNNKRHASILLPSPTTTKETLAQRRYNNHPVSLTTTSELLSLNTSTNNATTHQNQEQQEILITQITKRLSLQHQPIKEQEEEEQAEEEQAEEEWIREFLENPLDVKKRRQLLYKKIPTEKTNTIIWKSLVQPSLKSSLLFDSLYSKGFKGGLYDEMIEKDFPTVEKACLRRILKAYSMYDVRVGYHPKLATLISPLLAVKMPENEAFSIFVRLMETYDMRQLYMLNMEGLDLLVQQFQALFQSTLPKLATHLDQQLNIQASMYASRWFLTLFTTTVTDVTRLYDLVFLQGAIPTMIRVAIYILQKNEQELLKMDQQQDALDVLTKQQQQVDMDDILPLTPLVFNLEPVTISVSSPPPPPLPTIAAAPTKPPQQQQQQQQLEELKKALAQLQKENAVLARDNKMLKMHEMDQEAAQLKLVKRNTVLEKRVKKYKVKLANASVPTTTTTTVPKAEAKEEEQKSKKQDQFSSFVASLRDTGDFGALIAGALAPKEEESEEDVVQSLGVASVPTTKQVTVTTKSDEEEEEEETSSEDDQKKLNSALQNVTSELVAVKLDHFETCQKYESLQRHCQDLTHQLNTMQTAHTTLCQKVIYLESELEDVLGERDQIFADQEEVLEMAMVAKKTSAELQLENLELAKQVNHLENKVKELEKEKQAFFMPRDTFTEEVFAAHTILFGSPSSTEDKQQKKNKRQSTLKEQVDVEEYKQKFVESELRCRELEKYLAETKVKLAEFESGGSVTSQGHRVSLQLSPLQQRRASTYSVKRHSIASSSLSMLASNGKMERRCSVESFASSTTSMTSFTTSSTSQGGVNSNGSKRSSVYSRIWNAFGSPPATPTTASVVVNGGHNNGKTGAVGTNNIILCEEPQMIQ